MSSHSSVVLNIFLAGIFGHVILHLVMISLDRCMHFMAHLSIQNVEAYMVIFSSGLMVE